MKSYVEFNEDEWPILIARFSDKLATDEDIEQYLAKQTTYVTGDHPYYLIYDARKAKFPSFQHLRRISDWVAEHMNDFRRNVPGLVFVIPNPVVRQSVKLSFSLQPYPAPYKVVKTMSEARDWIATLQKSSDTGT